MELPHRVVSKAAKRNATKWREELRFHARNFAMHTWFLCTFVIPTWEYPHRSGDVLFYSRLHDACPKLCRDKKKTKNCDGVNPAKNIKVGIILRHGYCHRGLLKATQKWIFIRHFPFALDMANEQQSLRCGSLQEPMSKRQPGYVKDLDSGL